MDFFYRNLEAAQEQARSLSITASNSAKGFAEQLSEHTKILAEQAATVSSVAAEQASQRWKDINLQETLQLKALQGAASQAGPGTSPVLPANFTSPPPPLLPQGRSRTGQSEVEGHQHPGDPAAECPPRGQDSSHSACYKLDCFMQQCECNVNSWCTCCRPIRRRAGAGLNHVGFGGLHLQPPPPLPTPPRGSHPIAGVPRGHAVQTNSLELIAGPTAEELERYGITSDFKDFIRSLTYSTFRDFPLDQLPEMRQGGGEKTLTHWQEKHALLVVQEVSFCLRFSPMHVSYLVRRWGETLTL